MKADFVKYAQKNAIIANLIGLAIPFLWVTIYVLQQDGFPNGLYWYQDVEYPVSILIGCMAMLATSYFVAGCVAQRKLASKTVFIFANIGAALLAHIIGSFLGSIVFFIEYHTGIGYEISVDLLLKYIGIPTLFFAAVGAIPAGIFGGIGGWLTYIGNKPQNF